MHDNRNKKALRHKGLLATVAATAAISMMATSMVPGPAESLGLMKKAYAMDGTTQYHLLQNNCSSVYTMNETVDGTQGNWVNVIVLDHLAESNGMYELGYHIFSSGFNTINTDDKEVKSSYGTLIWGDIKSQASFLSLSEVPEKAKYLSELNLGEQTLRVSSSDSQQAEENIKYEIMLLNGSYIPIDIKESDTEINLAQTTETSTYTISGDGNEYTLTPKSTTAELKVGQTYKLNLSKNLDEITKSLGQSLSVKGRAQLSVNKGEDTTDTIDIKDAGKNIFEITTNKVGDVTLYLELKVNDQDTIYYPVTLNVESSSSGSTPSPSGPSGPSSPSGPSAPARTSYKVETLPSEHGSIESSVKSAYKGDKVILTPEEDSNYQTDQVTVTDKKGQSVETTQQEDGTWIFTMPASDVDVSASFEQIFTDIDEDAFYKDAVDWLYTEGITSGTGDGQFSPDRKLTRGEAVTFLSRYEKADDYKAVQRYFYDIATENFSYQPAHWAYEEGITTGIAKNTFGPSLFSTRAQFITFLWRLADAPKAEQKSAFTDVKPGIFYEEAVSWAAENGITTGTTKTTFSPDSAVTRGQAAVFLYRFHLLELETEAEADAK